MKIKVKAVVPSTSRLMKDSGIPWIGSIPVDWEVAPLKSSIRWKSEKNHNTEEVLSLYRDYGIIPKESRDDNHNVTSLDTSNYKFVEPYDLVINKMKAWQGSLAVSYYQGIVSPAYHVCSIVNKKIEPKYLHYLLRSSVYLPEYSRLSTGMRVGQWDLGFEEFKNIPFLLPPLNEQEKIVGFLDSQCARIDTVIDKTRESIEEYKKLKQSIITEAVTKGIRPNRKMKDSRVSWIDVIPEEWNTSRIKSLFIFGKGLPITKENLLENGVSVISYGQIHSKANSGVSLQEELFRFVSEDYLTTNPTSLVKRTDFIFADTSEDREGCGNCVYVDSDMVLFAGYHTIVFSSKDKTDKKYLAYLFKTDAWRSQIREKVSGVKLFSISRKILNDATVLLPGDKEQHEIVEYLDEKCSEMDSLIAQKEQLISELDKFKKSIIYEYVTGKKEVQV